MGGMISQMKYMGYGMAQTFPPKPTFSTDQIPDLTGRVVIVTGSFQLVFNTVHTHVAV